MGNAPSVTLDTYAHLFEERLQVRMDPAAKIEAARRNVDVRAVYAEVESLGHVRLVDLAKKLETLFRTRTVDPFLNHAVRRRRIADARMGRAAASPQKVGCLRNEASVHWLRQRGDVVTVSGTSC